MSKLVLFFSMSLDGFIAARNVRPEEPMGDGGLRLHEWAMGEADDPSSRLLAEAIAAEGAILVGRTTYDYSIRWWGADGPTGATRTPVFVVTHEPPAESPPGGVYTFVTGGIEEAVARAKEAAGAKFVGVGGGADVAQQLIRAGLLDEIRISLVPVLFGGGLRLFEHLGPDHISLERLEVIDTPAVTHLRYRIVK